MTLSQLPIANCRKIPDTGVLGLREALGFGNNFDTRHNYTELLLYSICYNPWE